MTASDTSIAIEIAQALQSLGVLLIIFSGLFLIVQARRIAGRFIFLGFVAIVVSQIKLDVVNQILLLPMLFVAGVLIVLALYGLFLAVFIGSRAADVAIGNIVANLSTAVVLLMFVPFKKLWKFLERSRQP